MMRLINILVTVSRLICILLAVLLVAVHTHLLDPHWTWISPGGDLYALSLRGLNRLNVGVTLTTIPQFRPPQGRWSASPVAITELVNPAGKPYAFQGFPFFGGERFRPILPPFSGVPQPNWSAVVIRYPSLILVSAILPAIRGIAVLRQRSLRRRRRRLGLCPVCGYDLRASKDRCPECGTMIPEKAERCSQDRTV